MKKHIACAMIVSMVLNPVLAADTKILREAWVKVMTEHGAAAGQGSAGGEQERVLDELVKISVQTGYQPGANMPEDQWRLLYGKAQEKAKKNAEWVETVSADGGGLTEAQKGMPPVNLGPLTPVPADTTGNTAPPSPALSPAEGSANKEGNDGVSREARPVKVKSISLDMRDMDIVEALKIFSRQTGLNIVVGKNVSGKVTVFLKDVDCWEALRQILETRDLAYVEDGDIVKVITAQDYEKSYGVPFGDKIVVKTLAFKNVKAKSAKDVLEPLKSKVGALSVNELNNTLIVEDTPEQIIKMEKMAMAFDTPLETRVFKLSYGTVDDVLPKISGLVSKEFGNVQADKRSNSIVVKDNPARILEMADIIKAFDSRNKAVLIEAKIVQVTLSDNFQWGINWQGMDWTYFFDKMRDYHVSGSLVQNMLLVPRETVTGGNATAQGITASLGVLEKPNFNAVANFLQTVGNTKLLSSPRIMALNNQEAKIHVGSKEAKITRSIVNAGSTTTSPITTENVEFVDVGVKLAVTPSIGDDGMITLTVKPEVSSVERLITTASGSSIPVVRISEAEASLVVKDGITVVIGGLIEDKKANTEARVPFLGRLPLIGFFFRSRDKAVQKTELVIFLTPHIIAGDTVSAEAQKKFDIEPDGTPAKKKPGFWKRLLGKA